MQKNDAAPADKRCWLILSYAANIAGSACANHIDDRLQPFQEQGIEPLLLSGRLGGRITTAPHYRIASFGPSGWRTELRHFFKRRGNATPWYLKPVKPAATVILAPFYILEKLFIDLDNGWTWFPLAFFKGLQLCRNRPVERIYSTGGSVSAHIAAGLIARFTGLPWFAEFQDPLVQREWTRSRRSLIQFTLVERWICKHADGVIFLTTGAMEAAKKRTELGDRGHVIFPGAPAKSAKTDNAPPGGDIFNIAHFGSLGTSRNLDGVLAGLKLMVLRNPNLGEGWHLNLYGNIDRGVKAAIAAFPWPQRITFHGMLSRDAAKQAMADTHLLLLIQNVHPVSSETIPSKFYEYLNCGRAILGLSFENPELDAMLHETGHLFAAADDPEGIASALERILQRWRAAKPDVKVAAASPWTVEAAVERILQLPVRRPRP